MGLREQLPAEADAEDRHPRVVGRAELLELGPHPAADRGVVVRRPRCAHRYDGVEAREVGERRGDTRPVVVLGGDDVVDHEVVPALLEAFVHSGLPSQHFAC